MKQVYNNINLLNGAVKTGLCKILIAPREWLINTVDIDFTTGKVISEIAFIFGKNWIELQFTPLSYDMQETPKTNRAGEYIETVIKGTINNTEADTLQVLNTLRYHEFIVVAQNRNGLKKILGDTEKGMIFSFGTKNPHNNLFAEVLFNIDTEQAAPIYEPV